MIKGILYLTKFNDGHLQWKFNLEQIDIFLNTMYETEDIAIDYKGQWNWFLSSLPNLFC